MSHFIVTVVNVHLVKPMLLTDTIHILGKYVGSLLGSDVFPWCPNTNLQGWQCFQHVKQQWLRIWQYHFIVPLSSSLLLLAVSPLLVSLQVSIDTPSAEKPKMTGGWDATNFANQEKCKHIFVAFPRVLVVMFIHTHVAIPFYCDIMRNPRKSIMAPRFVKSPVYVRTYVYHLYQETT